MKTPPPAKEPRRPRTLCAKAKVNLVYADPCAASVFVAGTFNQWRANELPMSAAKPGIWTAVLELAPGTYEYALIVDGCWIPDPHCLEKIAKPFGGYNSVLRVTPA